jgi:hypothetical protein
LSLQSNTTSATRTSVTQVRVSAGPNAFDPARRRPHDGIDRRDTVSRGPTSGLRAADARQAVRDLAL